MIDTCPFCDSTDIHSAESLAEFNDRRKKQLLTVRLTHTECRSCDREFTTPEQGIVNTQRIEDERRAAGGAPSAAEIIAMRKRMDLNQLEAGELFGGGPVAFSKYENETIVPAQSMARLLALAVAERISREDLEQAATGRLAQPLRTRPTARLRTFSPIDLIPATNPGDSTAAYAPVDFSDPYRSWDFTAFDTTQPQDSFYSAGKLTA